MKPETSGRAILLVLALLFASAAPASERVKESPHQVLYRLDGVFDDVKENIQMAIEDQGLVINYIAQVGDMLNRTGKDLGFDEEIYTHGDVIEFCSASLSREMALADPTNLVFCPYAIHVYELAANPGVVYVGWKRPVPVGDDASKAALAKIDDLLAEIVNAATAW